MEISIEMIKEVRKATGAGIVDCRNALSEFEGDIDKALESLREKGMAKAAKRAGRVASEGKVEIYSHGDGRVGVMVEVNCETDFVARSDNFREFAHELALQIAASAPIYVSEDDIPEEILAAEAQAATDMAKEEGKPENIVPRIVEGYIKKFKDSTVLLRQQYIRDDNLTVQDLFNQAVAALGENIVIRRFERFELGETTQVEEEEE
jgi:elongation factor Ts